MSHLDCQDSEYMEGISAYLSCLRRFKLLLRFQHLSYLELATGLLSVYLILRYAYAYKRFRMSQRMSEKDSDAPTFPNFFSRIETNIWLLLREKNAVYSATTCGDTQTPVRLNVIPESVYFIQGKSAITSLWKQSSRSQALGLLNVPFRAWFQMSQSLVDKFVSDTSGCAKKPLPESDVKAQNRTERISQSVFREVLSGPTFPSVCALFTDRLIHRLANIEVGPNWVEKPDFFNLFLENVTPPNIESLWGTQLTEHSSFSGDFWPFNLNLHYFSRGLPRWLTPESWSRRDRMLETLREWNEAGASGAAEDDRLRWGSRVLRERTSDFLQVDNTTSQDLPSIHLTFIWAANANINPLSFWATLDIVKRPELLAEVQRRLPQIRSMSEFREKFSQKETRDKICTDDLLLSIYAETLRLRVHTCILRRFPHEEVSLAGTKIAKDQLCIVSTYPAHMHGKEWNTKHGAHPLKDFWAHRFLRNEALKADSLAPSFSIRDRNEKSYAEETLRSEENPWKFSMDGLEGSWIPYGGGTSICPGRHLAKHHLLITVAAMITLFDFEIVANEKDMQMSDFYYGIGAQHPKGQIAFRFRKRI